MCLWRRARVCACRLPRSYTDTMRSKPAWTSRDSGRGLVCVCRVVCCGRMVHERWCWHSRKAHAVVQLPVSCQIDPDLGMRPCLPCPVRSRDLTNLPSPSCPDMDPAVPSPLPHPLPCPPPHPPPHPVAGLPHAPVVELRSSRLKARAAVASASAVMRAMKTAGGEKGKQRQGKSVTQEPKCGCRAPCRKRRCRNDTVKHNLSTVLQERAISARRPTFLECGKVYSVQTNCSTKRTAARGRNRRTPGAAMDTAPAAPPNCRGHTGSVAEKAKH